MGLVPNALDYSRGKPVLIVFLFFFALWARRQPKSQVQPRRALKTFATRLPSRVLQDVRKLKAQRVRGTE